MRFPRDPNAPQRTRKFIDDVRGVLNELVAAGTLQALPVLLLPASSSAPATAASTGTPGQVAYDATHIYVCVAANTWVRASLATW